MYKQMKLIVALMLVTLMSKSLNAQRFVFDQIETESNCYNGNDYKLYVELEIEGIQVNAINYDDHTNGDFNFDVIISIKNSFEGIVTNPNDYFWTYLITLKSENENVFSNILDQSFNEVIKLTDSTYSGLNMQNNSNFNGSANKLNLTAHTFYDSKEVIDLFGFSEATVMIQHACVFYTGAALSESALPISLIAFDAQATEEGNRLTWSTAKEQTDWIFEIQKSSNASEWATIDWIKASTTQKNNLINEYVYFDDFPINGDNYYRLKIVDTENKEFYSLVKHLPFTSEKISIEVFPNPSKDLINIKSDQKINQIQLLNSTGKLMKEYSVNDFYKQLSLNDITSGFYILNIGYHNGSMVSRTIIVE